MRTIPLRGKYGAGRFAVVDDEDYAALCDFKWSVMNTGYAARYINAGPYKSYTILMHREIMGVGRGDKRHVDHRDLDKLNCRRSNLRACTQAENNQNVAPRGRSSYRGVTFDKRRGHWLATGRVGGQRFWLGSFDDELDAARAAQQFRLEHVPFAVEPVLL